MLSNLFPDGGEERRGTTVPGRQRDRKTGRRGPQVLSKKLPNTIDRRRVSFPPPGRVVGSKSLACRATRPAAAERTSWRRRRLRCATQTDGAACRRERYAARPRRARARLRVLRLRAALKRRSAFMTCMPGTLGQSTTHGDGRDDAPLCKNASAGCPTFRVVPSNPPPPRITLPTWA